MTSKWLPIIDNVIWIIYLALAIATPLIFTTFNTELFEIPKMYFVYLGAVLILFLTLAKFILIGKILVPRNIVLTILTVFVVVQIVSTLFSIDKFTSIFGFPTRLNGGLLSQFAYFMIFAGVLINLNFEKAKKVLFAIVLAAFAVSLWGIPGHFGKDPSCFVLTGELTSSCWKKEFDPTLRVFSTLGQPNWLASYLVLVLPISVAFFLNAKKQNLKIFFLLATSFIFWALLLANSRAGVLGVAGALIIFLLLLGTQNLKIKFRQLLLIFTIFALLALIFGNFLTSRTQEAFSNPKSSSTISQTQTDSNQQQISSKPTQTSLETGGTESGQIRLIVWQGAIAIFRNWPILGSGPETFVSSYFIFRPAAHNQTTEWDFFYNKAHNEFLNYLANTGILGFVLYIAFLLIASVQLFKLSRSVNDSVILKAVPASIIGYLITIFFGFSVVATQTTFFLILPASILSKEPEKFPIHLGFLKEKLKPAIVVIISILGLFVLTLILRLYFSNIFEKRAETLKSTDIEKGLIAYSNAIDTIPTYNPYLFANYSTSIALAASALEDAPTSSTFSQSADNLAQKSLNFSPHNFLIAQRASQTYILLAQIDDSYKNKATNVCQKLITLASTYPPAYLNCAKVQIASDNYRKAIEFTQKALELKPEYPQAQELLQQLTIDN